MASSIVQVLLAVAAWADLARRPSQDVRGSKRLWALAILVNFAGPVAYLAWGRRRTPSAATSSRTSTGR